MTEPGGVPALVPALQEFQAQTLRQVARMAVSGDALRITLSNQYGTEALVVPKVRVARALAAGAVDASSDTAVLFNGQASVTIAPGAEATSDAVALRVENGTDVSVSLYLPRATGRTAHRYSDRTNYLAAGDQAGAGTLTGAQPLASAFFMPRIEVLRSATPRVVVAFGDSITEGFGTALDSQQRWTDQLRLRLAQAGRDTAVLNAGIAGNRWVLGALGPAGASRFARDVLQVRGVTHVVIHLGINDIGNGWSYSRVLGDAAQLVTAQQITAAIRTAVQAAKAQGLKVYVATLLPYRGCAYYTDAAPYNGEAERQAVNAFIRANTAGADGVLDWDLLLRDPADPLWLRPAFDSGDHLHPNAAGHAAIANALDLITLN
ncbi:GDSL-type esterase/lipase family protein [Ramlibacter albus]|uniref:SGNH/GDSL hydrolase family protein n=1 Tax=Ramlibacter albus TaxID=2079448 RepID=A0A923M8C2_9BURK|nr:GDSL-type esterase/lipase family protein [Ramlibacter albus]MBC5764594.1 SGNH/GDSL hydrolase family protein [Ramlibacter albus]